MKQKQKFKTSTLLILLVSFSFGLVRCKKDASTVPSATDNTLAVKHTGSVNLATTSGAYDITNSLPSGYVKDGSVDYTAYLQKAINTYSNIVFPAFPIMVNDAGLTIGSNKTITFNTGSKLVLKPTSTGNYNILNVLMADNVTLNNPVIVGDRYNHIGTSGEWGMGLAINGSTNVVVNNPNITNCWGDGIYLSQKGGINNQNITITNASCVHNRRNGIAITNVIGLDMESPYVAYTDGIAPYTGIDIEPNSPSDEIQNIVINNASTAYNPGYGISTGLKNLFGGGDKTIGIQLNNPSDKGSAIAFHATTPSTVSSGSVTGPINIATPFWRRNTSTPVTTDLNVKSIQLNISNPIVQDANGVNLSQSQIVSTLTYKTHINSTANYSITF